MEKYLFLLLLTAPGFISKFTAQCLGSIPPKRGEFESVMVYFSYSLFSIALSLFVAWGTGMFSLDEKWIVFESNFVYPWFTVKFFIISVFCSVIIGAIWELWLEKIVINLFNLINKILGGNEVFLDGSLFHKIFNDGKDHFIVVKKDQEEIIVGFFKGIASAKAEHAELYVTAHSDYKKWLDYAHESDPKHPLNTVKGVYIDFDSGIVVQELDYPLEWLTWKNSSESMEEAVEVGA